MKSNPGHDARWGLKDGAVPVSGRTLSSNSRTWLESGTDGAAHFHLVGRDGPDSALEIEFGPFALPQFAWTDETCGVTWSADFVMPYPEKPSMSRGRATPSEAM